MVKEGTLTLSKWGNSLSVRIPKDVLDSLNLSNDDKLNYEVKNDQIVLKPAKKRKAIDVLLDGYDRNKEYPFEIVDKGGAVGEELY